MDTDLPLAPKTTLERRIDTLRRELARERQVSAQLRQQLEVSQESQRRAYRLAAWGGARKIDGRTRDEH